VPVLENVLRDLSYGLRGLRKSPLFTLAAIAILGLGIGVNTAIFTIVNAVLLRPLPFRDPDRIVRLWHTPPPSFTGMETFSLSPANLIDWERQSASFEHVGAFQSRRTVLTGDGDPESLVATRASSSVLTILGLEPVLGHAFTTEQDAAGGPAVVLLSEEFWRSRFGADPSVVGRTIRLDGESVQVVGVVPHARALLTRTQVWNPLAWSAEDRAVRENHNYSALAKLKRGITIAAAQKELDTIAKRLEIAYPADNKDWGALVVGLREDLVGEARSSLAMLLAAVGLVLLIACANLANLLLVRTHGRARELAVRTAMGASRVRVAAQLLIEGALLGAVGGLFGVAAAFALVRALVASFGSSLPRATEVAPDITVLLFTTGVALAAGLLAAAVPAWRLTREGSAEILKAAGRGNSAAGDGALRNLLVVTEVALAVMLLLGAGLLMKSLAGLRSVDPGFDAKNALTLSVSFPTERYKTPDAMHTFLTELTTTVGGLPGARSAAIIDSLPFSGGSSQPVSTERTAHVPSAELPVVAVRYTVPGYFETVGIPLQRGRDLERADDGARRAVAVIDEATATQLWPGEDPVGKTLILPLLSKDPREVVGVVRSVKMGQLDERETQAAVYIPVSQLDLTLFGRSLGFSLVVRTEAPPETLSRPVTDALRGMNPDLLARNILTLEQVVEESLGQRPSAMRLLGSFALVALLLAAVGIYSVIAYAVGQRVREIGIRLALGAPAASVVKMVVTEGMRPTLLGIGAGIALSAGLVRFLSSQLYGVSAYDPATFVLVAGLVGLTGIAASAVPAWRATRVDPSTTLRAD
jgi:putative ABC transport system permease protein